MESSDDRYLRLVNALIDITDEVGWKIAIPATDASKAVDGLFVGSPEFIATVVEILHTNAYTPTTAPLKNKKPVTFH